MQTSGIFKTPEVWLRVSLSFQGIPQTWMTLCPTVSNYLCALGVLGGKLDLQSDCRRQSSHFVKVLSMN